MTKRIIELTKTELEYLTDFDYPVNIFRFKKWIEINDIQYFDLNICPNLALLKDSSSNCIFCGVDKALMFVVEIQSLDAYELFCVNCLQDFLEYRPIYFSEESLNYKRKDVK